MGRAIARNNASVGDLRGLRVTVPQAARILDLGTDQVRRAIQLRVVTPTFVLEGERRVRALDGIDVLCLRMREQLKGAIRDQLYMHLKGAPDGETLRQAFRVRVDRTQVVSSKATPVWVLEAAIETLADIEALKDPAHQVDVAGRLRDSGVEAHRVAALVEGGMSPAAILADYPNLDRTQIEVAVRHARSRPAPSYWVSPGVYPAGTVKAARRDDGSGRLGAVFAAARGTRPIAMGRNAEPA